MKGKKKYIYLSKRATNLLNKAMGHIVFNSDKKDCALVFNEQKISFYYFELLQQQIKEINHAFEILENYHNKIIYSNVVLFSHKPVMLDEDTYKSYYYLLESLEGVNDYIEKYSRDLEKQLFILEKINGIYKKKHQERGALYDFDDMYIEKKTEDYYINSLMEYIVKNYKKLRK